MMMCVCVVGIPADAAALGQEAAPPPGAFTPFSGVTGTVRKGRPRKRKTTDAVVREGLLSQTLSELVIGIPQKGTDEELQKKELEELVILLHLHLHSVQLNQSKTLFTGQVK
ncbi:hypothetical protein CEXT_717601 [Caerostris extrusa]|uniref:Uncharacterized protein n=1 Tax=Caerostris extrusa TaxID=172846 RepID=A0AAV4NPC4_CAEEX|nr:hypothetical protein CEXT_717601 [Caerostris extrusa]